ncbi:unnamed protein product, partial [Rotaria sp. Silwood2]
VWSSINLTLESLSTDSFSSFNTTISSFDCNSCDTINKSLSHSSSGDGNPSMRCLQCILL